VNDTEMVRRQSHLITKREGFFTSLLGNRLFIIDGSWA
jgi:hypothetical protein